MPVTCTCPACGEGHDKVEDYLRHILATHPGFLGAEGSSVILRDGITVIPNEEASVRPLPA